MRFEEKKKTKEKETKKEWCFGVQQAKKKNSAKTLTVNNRHLQKNREKKENSECKIHETKQKQNTQSRIGYIHKIWVWSMIADLYQYFRQ